MNNIYSKYIKKFEQSIKDEKEVDEDWCITTYKLSWLDLHEQGLAGDKEVVEVLEKLNTY